MPSGITGCNPFGGAVMCPAGEGCYPSFVNGSLSTECFPPRGSATSGPCDFANSCAAGYSCQQGPGYGCLRMCAYPNGACPAGTMCQTFGLSGSLSTVGYCRSEP